MHEPIRAQYRRFADVEIQQYSPLYHQLAHAVADDDQLIGFIASMPESQPNLFLAAVQYVSGPEHMPQTGSALREFVHEHREEVADLMHARRTQTNEVGRCAVLLPAMPEGPLAIIEVGASAGLCLLLDRYRYDYAGVQLGSADSPVVLRCQPLGDVPPPLRHALPSIVWRHGLDLRPVDLREPGNARWLLACIWADHPERRRRLEAAIALARLEPPPVRAGDLVTDLPDLVAEAPGDAQLVIFHSAVLPYVDLERRRAFVDLLGRLSHGRRIVWLSNEGAGGLPDLEPQAPERNELRFQLLRTQFARGTRRGPALLALAHYHGSNMEWLQRA